MIIEQYIEIAKKEQEVDGISLTNSETLEYRNKSCPEGYYKVLQWLFSDGTVIHFEDDTDTETSWKGHLQRWNFKIKGSRVSQDSKDEIVSKFGNI